MSSEVKREIEDLAPMGRSRTRGNPLRDCVGTIASKRLPAVGSTRYRYRARRVSSCSLLEPHRAQICGPGTSRTENEA